MISQVSGNTVKPRPLLITLGIHALLLLFLLLWKFTLPAQLQPVQDSGLEVNLGTSADGSGNDQPMDVEDPAAAKTANARAAASGGQAEVVRSDDPDAPSLISNARRAANIADRPQVLRGGPDRASSPSTHNAQAQQQAKYVYEGSSGKGGNSAAQNATGAGEGITGRPGDQGVPNGTPGATNYSGTPGSGNGGYSIALGGRTIERAPTEGERFREGGRVMVHVTVNRAGEIVNKRVLSSTNTELNQIALRRLQGVRFNKSETAPAEQFGSITFVFKTRQ